MPGLHLILGMVLPLVALPAEGLSDGDLLNRAEASFHRGIQARSDPGQGRQAFDQAATDYEALRQRGFRNANLLHNEGNAYLLAGDLPQAILAYRRGLRLAPNDRALRANLNYALGQVADPSAASLGKRPGWPRPSRGVLLALLLGSYTLACVCLTRWWMVRRAWLLGMAVSAGILAAGMAAGLVWEVHARRQEAAHPLVVIAQDGVKLRRGNGFRYPPRDDAILNRGVEGRWLYTRGDWYQIELAAGRVGWVPRADVLLDEP